MLTQFGKGGISLLLDKSSFQSFSFDELLLLHKYFWVNISPILVKEVLADLKKENNKGEIYNKKVIEFAKKLSRFNSSVNTSYIELIERELLGESAIPLYTPIVNTGEPMRMPNGKIAINIRDSEERIAIERWREDNFSEAELHFSRDWRDSKLKPDLEKVKKHYINEYPFFEKLKTPEEILDCFDRQFNQPDFYLTTLKLFLKEFSITAEKAGAMFYRWETSTEKTLKYFAPYSLFCLRARFLFYISLRNGLINTKPTNWHDLEYCYYLPFCRVFLSDDKIFDNLVPYLIDKNQQYYKGAEIKKDLKKIMEIKEASVIEQKRKLESEPPRIPELLIYQIWNKMLLDWPPQKDWEPSEEEFKMMQEAIGQFRNATPLNNK